MEDFLRFLQLPAVELLLVAFQRRVVGNSRLSDWLLASRRDFEGIVRLGVAIVIVCWLSGRILWVGVVPQSFCAINLQLLSLLALELPLPVLLSQVTLPQSYPTVVERQCCRRKRSGVAERMLKGSRAHERVAALQKLYFAGGVRGEGGRWGWFGDNLVVFAKEECVVIGEERVNHG
jgi:hypothetical protein